MNPLKFKKPSLVTARACVFSGFSDPPRMDWIRMEAACATLAARHEAKYLSDIRRGKRKMSADRVDQAPDFLEFERRAFISHTSFKERNC